MSVLIFLFWLFFSFAAGMFANLRRNRDGFGWFAVGILFSPLVAFILLAILHPLPPAEVQSAEERKAGNRLADWLEASPRPTPQGWAIGPDGKIIDNG